LASGPLTQEADRPSGRLTFDGLSPYDGNSTPKARLFVLEAGTGKLLNPPGHDHLTVPEEGSFFNDPFVPLPLNRRTRGVWHDEMVYYGLTVSRDSLGLDKGAVYRLQMVDSHGLAMPVSRWQLKRLAKVDKPVTGAVNAARDEAGNMWVLFGTGRLWSRDDFEPCRNTPSQECLENHEHYIFGLKEELVNGKMTFQEKDMTALADVTGAKVLKSGQVADLLPIKGLNLAKEGKIGYDNLSKGGSIDYDKLAKFLRKTAPGYKRRLAGGEILFNFSGHLEMVLTQPQITSLGIGKSIMGLTSYDAQARFCGDFGRGFLYLLDPFTGLPAPDLALNGPALADWPRDWNRSDSVPGIVFAGLGRPSEAILVKPGGRVLGRFFSGGNSFLEVEISGAGKYEHD
jgi:hypothetical protein